MMGCDELEAFATEFSLLPRLLSKPLLFRLFRTVSPNQRPMQFSGFVECVGRIALLGLESMNDTLPTPALKLSSLIDRLRVTPKLDAITRDAHERGLGDGLDVYSSEEEDSPRAARQLSDGNLLMQSASPQLLVRASRRRQRSYMKALASPVGFGSDSASVTSSSVASSGIMAQLMEAAYDKDSGSVASGSTQSSRGSRRLYRRSASAPKRLAAQADRGSPLSQLVLPQKEFVLSSTLAESVASKLLPEYQDRMWPLFEFYCRIGDPSNEGHMSQANFVRLMQDCEAIDEHVTISMIDVQLAIIVQRRRRSSGLQPGADDHRVPRLDMPLFLEALVRVSQLVFIARESKRLQAPDSSSSASGGGMPSLLDAIEFARLFFNSRVLPLSILAVAEEETFEVLQQPDVALCMSSPDNERFLKVGCLCVVLCRGR